jgi:hypothetical protein
VERGRLTEKGLLTSHCRPHNLDEAVDDLEDLRHARPSLVLCEPIQRLQRRFGINLSPSLVPGLLCIELSEGTYQ